MAVEPAMHRRGVGQALVGALEDDLVAHVELVQVKTLGPSHPDTGYARMRQFYTRVGFGRWRNPRPVARRPLSDYGQDPRAATRCLDRTITDRTGVQRHR
jgi:GNAT superfamily N-acetyltransferase